MSTTNSEPQSLSTKKKLLFSLLLCFVLIVLCLLSLEIVLRVKGLRPWIIRPNNIVLEPKGSYHIKDSTLGYITKPGEFKITLPGPYSFKATHLSNGSRITQPLNAYSGQTRKGVWIFGCSFTQGWSVNDNETYPWLLQEKLTDYEVVNFGVDAYSTVQSLIQFQEALKVGKKPDLVILAYGSFQDFRNTQSRSWLKIRLGSVTNYQELSDIRIPYARLTANLKPEIWYAPFVYHEFPLMRYSSLANFLDETYNESVANSHYDHEVSRALIEEFSNLCKAEGIKFVVAGIYSDAATAEMLQHCAGKGIMAVDISVELTVKENTNLPYDGHPSALANQQYAKKLESFLCSSLIDERSCYRP